MPTVATTFSLRCLTTNDKNNRFSEFYFLAVTVCLQVENPTELHDLHVGKFYCHPFTKIKPNLNPNTNHNPNPANPINPVKSY